LLEDDPNYQECPECGEELEELEDGVWYCEECNMYFNTDGEEIDYDPFDEDEDV
jgi:ribosomal protein L37AE/L43A